MTQTPTDEPKPEEPLPTDKKDILTKAKNILAQALLPSYNKISIAVDRNTGTVSADCLKGYMAQTNEELFNSRLERVMTGVIAQRLLDIILNTLTEDEQMIVVCDIADDITQLSKTLLADTKKRESKISIFDAQGKQIKT